MTSPANLSHLRKPEPADQTTAALIKAVAALDAIASLLENVIKERNTK